MIQCPLIALYGSYSRGFGFIVMIFMAVWFVLNAAFSEKEIIKKILAYSYFSALIVATYAISQTLGFDPLFGNFKNFLGRSFGFIGNPSLLGQFLALEFVIGLYFFIETKKNLQKSVVAFSLFIIIAGLLVSETRAAVLAVVVGIILLVIKYYWMAPAEKKGKILIVGGISMVTVAIVLLGIFGTIANENRFDLSSLSLRSFKSRLEIWKASSELILERPLLGYGAETFSVYFPNKVSKSFFTLEESLNISADRIHNEFLETVFSAGIFAGLFYVAIIGFVVYRFFTTKDRLMAYLSLLVLINFMQNQLAFPDVNTMALSIFCLVALVSLETRSTIKILAKPVFAYIQFAGILLGGIFIFHTTIQKPMQSHLSYTLNKYFQPVSFDASVFSLKNATVYTPQYSQLWYDLLIIDSASMPRALHYLEQIEGPTGDFLAWKANFYSLEDPSLSRRYFELLLRINPKHPNWTRAYADHLYRNEQYQEALIMYKKYLELVPDFWKWENLAEKSPEEQKSYRVFFKNVPDFWHTVERIKQLEESKEILYQ